MKCNSITRLAHLSYDFNAESQRLNFPNIECGGYCINRGRSSAGFHEAVDLSQAFNIGSEDYGCALLPTGLNTESPIIDISLPVAGHYYATKDGIGFDAYLGVGQRLIDENHENLKSMLSTLMRYGAILRREAATKDRLVASAESGIVTPNDLATLLNSIAASAFKEKAPYSTYLSSSGTETIETAMKIACRYKARKVREKYGDDIQAKLMEQLAIPMHQTLGSKQSQMPLYSDYPFFFISATNGFHGRTLGALSLTNVSQVQKECYPSFKWVRHIPFNERNSALDELLDSRDLSTILDLPGELDRIISQGHIPKDLVAGFVIEAVQGEGGYNFAEKEWLKALTSSCAMNDIILIADEVQTFARTGHVFAFEHYGISPDVICISKASVIGATLVSRKCSHDLPSGWQSSTWGGGKVFDNNYAWTVINTYLYHEDPVFGGMTYLQNQRTKASLIDEKFNRLQGLYPDLITGYRGLGGMWGFSVRSRERVCSTARRLGLKLLPTSGQMIDGASSVRALFLADVLSREIECFFRLLESTLAQVSGTSANT